MFFVVVDLLVALVLQLACGEDTPVSHLSGFIGLSGMRAHLILRQISVQRRECLRDTVGLRCVKCDISNTTSLSC